MLRVPEWKVPGWRPTGRTGTAMLDESPDKRVLNPSILEILGLYDDVRNAVG
jgi:hypothetical protein